MALGKFIKLNGTTMPNPNPGTFMFHNNADENIFTSESGYQLSNVKRLSRITWSASFNCTGSMMNTIVALTKTAQITCQVNGTNHNGRLRQSGDITLVENSEYTSGTDGLWVVPVIFEEI